MIEVALLQLDYGATETVAERRERVCAEVAELRGIDLVLLPELWPAGYFAFDLYREAAEPLDGPTVQALSQAARGCGAHLHGGSFLELADDGAVHNTSVLLDPAGELIGSYRKIHVFGYGSREADLVTPGTAPQVARTDLGRIGMTTCYDLRFPELYRAEIEAGAEILALPAAWPAARTEHWRLLLRARAVENQAIVIGCNAAGSDHGTAIAGRSAVIGPSGEGVAEADASPGTLRVRVDTESVAEAREEFPALADRRLTATAGASAEVVR